MLCAMFTSCVSLFIPDGIETAGGRLVVDGDIILNDTTKITLSNTIPLDKENKVDYIKNAMVWVEDENSLQYTGIFYEKADEVPYYAIITGGLDRTVRYKLCITLSNGKHYESDLLPVLETPEIDSIGFNVNEDRTMASFYVNTHAANNASRFYRWRYREDWEFTSPRFTNYRYDPKTDMIVEIPYEQNINYCWKKANSTAIILFNTNYLDSNVVYQKVLNNIDASDLRISYLYSMEVFQIAISEKAHQYWETLDKNTDQTGGIFAPQPSELTGNIQCVSHPGEWALGYVSVSTTVNKRVFFSKSTINIYNFAHSQCAIVPPGDGRSSKDMYHSGYYLIALSLDDRFEWGERGCIDCIFNGNGTKNKPWFWPNYDK